MARRNAPEKMQTKQNGLIVLILSILLGLALLIAAVFGTYAWTVSQSKDSTEASQQSQVETKGPVSYVKVKPVTVNLSGNRERVLYLGVSLKIRGEEQASRINASMPQIRSTILMTVNGRSAEELKSTQGKQQLADDIQQALSQPFDKGEKAFKIERVLFTDFVVQ